MKQALQRMRWVTSTQFGVDPLLLLRGLINLPRFLRDAWRFRQQSPARIEWMPCLQDWNQASGQARGEYFWQDLYVAQRVREASPQRHVDVGSRIDGFVAHVASFRALDVVDIRPLRSDIPGVRFVQHDMMSDAVPDVPQADSVSCLHALEHFGLGRYGDLMDANGHHAGLRNLARLVAPGGRLYLAVPIGRPRVVFNANRVFDPNELPSLAAAHGLKLDELVTITEGNAPQPQTDIAAALTSAAQRDYCLGIYVFSKPGNLAPSAQTAA